MDGCKVSVVTGLLKGLVDEAGSMVGGMAGGNMVRGVGSDDLLKLKLL